MSLHYQSLLKFIQQGRYFHCGNSSLLKSYGYIGNVAYQYLRLLEADSVDIHRKTFCLADYQPLSLRYYTNKLAQEMKPPSIPTLPLFVLRLIAISGDIINALGKKNFPFNSFRLNNIQTEYVFHMTSTERVCGTLPFT